MDLVKPLLPFGIIRHVQKFGFLYDLHCYLATGRKGERFGMTNSIMLGDR